LHGPSDFELDTKRIAQISFRKFLGFPGYIQAVPKSCHLEKELLITANKNKYKQNFNINFIAFVWKIRK